MTTTSEVVSRFPRYSREVTALPRAEQDKIARLARRLYDGLRGAAPALRRVRLTGHADLDTPRRPKFEYQVGLQRANDVRIALFQELDRLAPRAVPRFSTRLAFDLKSEGASRLVVPNPQTENDRLQNRRVEIALVDPRARGVEYEVPPDQPPWIKNLLERFGQLAPDDLPAAADRQNCVLSAADKSVQLCLGAHDPDRASPCCAPFTCPPTSRCYNVVRGADILIRRDYRAPIVPPITCCNVSTTCTGDHATKCTNCAPLGKGQYLVLLYQPDPLKRMIDKLKCALDRGCAVPVGVLSGICDDKPDTSKETCPPTTREKWRDCWEHWILIIGYDGNSFLFWDSSEASPIKATFGRADHYFGHLFYDAANNRFTTARNDADLEVTSDGFHTSRHQKRFQVTSLWPGQPWRAIQKRC